MDITIEQITPDIAQDYLALNSRNRALRRPRVQMYADQMLKGEWLLTGDPIRFDPDGVLLDGQHRLAGVILAGGTNPDIVIPMVIARNVETAAFKVLDSGLQRSVGDALGIGHVTDKLVKGAVVRIIITVERGLDPRQPRDRTSITRTEASDFYAAHEGAIVAAIGVGRPLYAKFVGGNLTAWAGFCYLAWEAVGEGADYVDEFTRGVFTGADLGAGDPRLALRNFLSNDRSLPSAGHHLHLLIKTWNAWMRGEQRQVVATRADEPWPTIVGQRVTRNGTPIVTERDLVIAHG